MPIKSWVPTSQSLGRNVLSKVRDITEEIYCLSGAENGQGTSGKDDSVGGFQGPGRKGEITSFESKSEQKGEVRGGRKEIAVK